MKQDLPLLSRCEAIIVLPLEGWRESQGVADELYYAQQYCLQPVIFLADCEALLDMPPEAELLANHWHCLHIPQIKEFLNEQ
jgi:hypothetical protein